MPPTVVGGVVVRDTNGRPTGKFPRVGNERQANDVNLGVFLDNAQELIKKPPLTEDDLMMRFTTTVRDALSKGITSAHDAGFDPASLAFYERSVRNGNHCLHF